MGGDRGDAKGLGGDPSPVGKAGHRDDGVTWGGRRVGISSCGGSNASRGTSPHMRLHQETEDDHIGKYGLPPHI